MELEPISTVSVVDEVVKRITGAIISKKLVPGQKIPTENELCHQLGVCRNSLREAMKILSAMGIVEIRRGDGTYIADKVSPSVFDSLIYSLMLERSTQEEILELRKTLEVDILELAIQKAGDEDIALLDNLLQDFRQMIDNKEYDKVADLDIKFHYALVDIAKNPLLGRIVKGVYSIFYPSVERTLCLKHEFEGAYKKHKDIVEVIRKKDKSQIEDVIKRSLEVWKDYWKNK